VLLDYIGGTDVLLLAYIGGTDGVLLAGTFGTDCLLLANIYCVFKLPSNNKPSLTCLERLVLSLCAI
jgi:hypothetical protein